MGASKFDVAVNVNGAPVSFDLYHMTKPERSHFHREFMRAVRKHMGKN